MRLAPALALPILYGMTATVFAETGHSDHSANMHHGVNVQDSGQAAVGALSEPGQGAFAALSEVVRALDADPGTDWSKVDLDALRAHLVDMDILVTDTTATETNLPDGIRIVVSGDAATLDTLRRMVPAHAAELAKDHRWSVTVSVDDGGVELTVTSDDPAVANRIRGLGFFGLMASQDHHREHHMMIARGQDPHRPLE